MPAANAAAGNDCLPWLRLGRGGVGLLCGVATGVRLKRRPDRGFMIENRGETDRSTDWVYR